MAEVPPGNASPTARKYSHYEVAYIKLRTSMAVLAISLPVSLFFVSYGLRKYGLLGSMSEYYTRQGFERDLFVGMLSCIGLFLILYEGYSNLENRVLDLAGVLLIGVAFVNMDKEVIEVWGYLIQVKWKLGKLGLSVHGLCATGFFLCMIYTTTVLSGQTLVDRDDKVRCKWLLRYWTVSTVMATAMVASLVLHQLEVAIFYKKTVFWIETIGVVSFAIFWLMKTREVNPTIGYQLRGVKPLDTAAKETDQPSNKLELLGEPETAAHVAGNPPSRIVVKASGLCLVLQALQRKLGAR